MKAALLKKVVALVVSIDGGVDMVVVVVCSNVVDRFRVFSFFLLSHSFLLGDFLICRCFCLCSSWLWAY